jgi:DNA-binding MarR family transcriptional regulator/GNAT superfamily N-acetyltransferase
MRRMITHAGLAASSQPESAHRVAAVRAFNRFYTQRIGVLADGYLGSGFSLTQARVLYELAHRQQPTASEIGRDLGLDAGYLSRIVRGFAQRGLLETAPSPRDGRQRLLSLSPRGRAVFATLEAASRQQIGAALVDLSGPDQDRLVAAMATVTQLLTAPGERQAAIALRPPRVGDLGWVVQRHGELYAAEYGWDETFEALVAEIVANFARDHDPARERCWIAERDGERVGSIFLVTHPEREGVAKLRLLLVEPSARGHGIGRRLVDACVRFAWEAGYHTVTLWTNSVLVSAGRIYEAAGFRLVQEAPHHSFGHDLVEQTWELHVGDGVVG